MDSISLKEVADFLLRRKGNGMVLFLGAKAGGFFENEELYTKLKGYSAETFDALKADQKFQACYRILEENLTERGRDTVLSQSMGASSDNRLEDDYLVELIKADFFDVIISTNIDLLLEDALRRGKVIEAGNYQLLIYEKASTSDIMSFQHRFVLKIFGDLESKHYKTAGDEFLFEEDKDLRDFLERIMDHDVLMVGYDPVWDGPFDYAFLLRGGELVYVNDVPVDTGSFITRIIQRRKGKCLVGEQGAYKSFMRNLYAELIERDPLIYAQLIERDPLSYEGIQKVSRQLQEIKGEITSLRDAIQNLENWLKSRWEKN